MPNRCASCDLTIATAGLRAQAAILDGLDRPEDAATARAEADRLDGLGCSWWWRRKTESVEPNPETGQHEEKVVEGCGKLALPAFLTDFGWSSRMAAQSVQTATSEAARAADGAERAAVAVACLSVSVDRHSELTAAALGAGKLLGGDGE